MSRALVTGGRGGIGRAIADVYDGEVVALDLPDFDVGSVEAWAALEDDEVGRAWIVQPNRIEPFRFPGLPGPR